MASLAHWAGKVNHHRCQIFLLVNRKDKNIVWGLSGQKLKLSPQIGIAKIGGRFCLAKMINAIFETVTYVSCIEN